MALNFNIYSNTNSSTKTITVDFFGDILVDSFGSGTASSEIEYYFKFVTSAKNSSNVTLPIKLVKGLDNLALNNNVQSATNTNADYSTISNMITDYVYDYIYGHTADQFLSGCTEQKPMKFN